MHTELTANFLQTLTAATSLLTAVSAQSCNADNCLRALRAPERLSEARVFCGTYTITASATVPTYASSACTGDVASRVSSACSCIATPTSTPPSTGKQRVKFTDPTSGNFSVRRTALQWTSQGGVDGNYVEQNSAGDLVFSNIVSGNTTTFVAKSSIAPVAQNFYDFSIQGSGYVARTAMFYTRGMLICY